MAKREEQQRYRAKKGVRQVSVELFPADVNRLDAVASAFGSRRAAILEMLALWERIHETRAPSADPPSEPLARAPARSPERSFPGLREQGVAQYLSALQDASTPKAFHAIVDQLGADRRMRLQELKAIAKAFTGTVPVAMRRGGVLEALRRSVPK